MSDETKQSPLVKWADDIAIVRSIQANFPGETLPDSTQFALDLADYAAALEKRLAEVEARIAKMDEELQQAWGAYGTENRICNDQELRLEDAKAELAAARAGTWQPVEDGAQYSLPDHTELQIWSDRLRIEGQGQIIDVEWIGPARLCRLTPVAANPQPDALSELVRAAITWVEHAEAYIPTDHDDWEEYDVHASAKWENLRAAVARVKGVQGGE